MRSFLVRRFSSFTFLNVTQFLGALNDNIYKLLIVYFLIQLEGIEKSHIVLSLTGATFVLPFLLFSASSGTLADRFSKRNIIVLTKVLELITMTLGVFAFVYESEVGSFCILFLMATQSAIFGPSKYGILPEIVSHDKISTANGLMTSFTFLAIIFGTFTASFVVDITNYDFFLASIFCTLIALIGLITSLCIEYTPPSGSLKRFNIRFLYQILSTLNIARGEPSLLPAIFGSAFFLFLGAYMQLNLIPYAVHVLGLTDIQGGYLFLLTALGIGAGALLAGKISGKVVELGIVPLAGVGITISCFLLDFYSDSFWMILFLVVIVGIFGGLYQIPLDSYVQVASPHKYRGQMIAATNFLSFFGVLCASVLLYVITETLGLSPNKGFAVIGYLSLIVTVVLAFQFFDYLTRLIGSVLSNLHFSTSLTGKENIPSTPAIYICTHRAWNDTLLLLSSQRRRMRFFIEQEQDHKRWLRRLYRMLRVVFIPDIEPLESNQQCIDTIKRTLKKGISVCIFIDSDDPHHEIEKLKSAPFSQILEDIEIPIIPVSIEKGTKEKKPRFFKRLYHKFRVPAAISFESAEG